MPSLRTTLAIAWGACAPQEGTEVLGEIRVCQSALGPLDPTRTPNPAHIWEGVSDVPGTGLLRGWEGKFWEQAARITTVPALIWLFHLWGRDWIQWGTAREGGDAEKRTRSIQGTRV